MLRTGVLMMNSWLHTASARLVRKLHAPQQLLEARVGAQAVQLGVGFEKSQVRRALAESSFNPIQGAVFVSQRGVNSRDAVGTDVLPARYLPQLLQDFSRLLSKTHRRIGLSEIGQTERRARGKLEFFLSGGNSGLIPCFPQICPSNYAVRPDIVRIKFECRLAFLDCPIVLSREPVDDPQNPVSRAGERIQPDRPLTLRVGLLEPSHQPQTVAEPRMCNRIAWIQLNGPLEASLRSNKIEVVPGFDHRQGGVRLRQSRIQIESPLRQFLGFAETFIRREKPEQTKQGEAVG